MVVSDGKLAFLGGDVQLPKTLSTLVTFCVELTRYLFGPRTDELCRLYHPDLRKGKESASSGNSGSGPSNPPDTTAELKQINAAYEILRNPSKRNTYLRTGYGWGTGTGAGVGGMSPNHRYRPAGSAAAASYAYGYDFVRGRPMRYTRGAYPSSAWDWSDPHNTRFRPGFAGGAGDGAAGMGGGSAAGWGSQGHVGSNGVVFLALCSLTLFVTPLTLWSATPTTGSEQGRSGLVPMVSDRRHVEAAKALETARREARSGDGGREKREAIS